MSDRYHAINESELLNLLQCRDKLECFYMYHQTECSPEFSRQYIEMKRKENPKIDKIAERRHIPLDCIWFSEIAEGYLPNYKRV